LTIETEYHGAVHAGIEAVWIQHFMGELGFLVKTLIVVCCDNQSVIQVAKNPVVHSEMKHVELHAQCLRQLVQDNIVDLVYCKTNDQVIGIFMKPLSKAKF
jgi:hypothetical protein